MCVRTYAAKPGSRNVQVICIRFLKFWHTIVTSHYRMIWEFQEMENGSSVDHGLCVGHCHKTNMFSSTEYVGYWYISDSWFLEVVFTKSIWGAALNINWNFCIMEANCDHLHVTRARIKAWSNNLRASKKKKKISWRVGWQMTNKLVFAPIPECPAKHLLSTPIKSLH